jgi:hypothetical protein
MPRSRRRKGAKPSLHEARRRELQQHVVPRRYYDPGAKPLPRNLTRGVGPTQQQQRHNHQRGG